MQTSVVTHNAIISSYEKVMKWEAALEELATSLELGSEILARTPPHSFSGVAPANQTKERAKTESS